jgi:long-chain acyl-CoA synthetase
MLSTMDTSLPQRISETVVCAALRHGDRLAMRVRKQGTTRTTTYAEMAAGISRGASLLEQAGITRGDRVVLLCENSPTWPIAYFAASAAGATVVPLDAGLKAAEWRVLFAAADARLVLASESFTESAVDAVQHACPGVPIASVEKLVAGDLTIAALPQAKPDADADPEVATILFTSGTSGAPKGVMLTHAGLINAAVACAIPFWGLVPEDEMLMVLPLHHVYGFCGLAGAFAAGAAITFIEAIRGDLIVGAMQETHTTVLPAVPRMLELIVQQIRREVERRGAVARTVYTAGRLSCRQIRKATGLNLGPKLFGAVFERFGGQLRRLVSAGAPLSIAVCEELEGLGFAVLEGYGLTETSASATGSTFAERQCGKVGYALPGMELRIEAPSALAEGEVCMRGVGLMRGYFRRPDLTARVLRDGWFHTGDLGRVDKRGFLAVLGRLDELIVTPAGKKALPADVEQLYEGLPGVRELAVVGVRLGNHAGEQIHAAVALEADLAALEAGEAQRRIEAAVAARNEQVPSYLQIQRVHVVAEIPKTTKLSVRRRELKRLFEEQATEVAVSRNATTLAEAGARDPLAARLLSLVDQMTGASHRGITVGLESSLAFDLAMDSLGRAALAATIEQELDVEIMQQMAVVQRVGDLVAAVHQAPRRVVARDTAALPATPPPSRGPIRRAVLAAFAWLAHRFWHIDAEGLESLPHNGYILCPNHATALDALWVAAAMPSRHRRHLCSLAKQELWHNPLTRLFAIVACAIPIDRDGDPQQALRSGIAALRSGRPLLVFPEGTRSISGSMGTFRRGAAHMAIASGAPLVPAYLHGAREAYVARTSLRRLLATVTLHRPRLVVHFGSPIYPESQSQPGNEETLTARLQKAVAQLAP